MGRIDWLDQMHIDPGLAGAFSIIVLPPACDRDDVYAKDRPGPRQHSQYLSSL